MNDKKELQVAALENGTVIDHIPSEKLFTVVSLLGSLIMDISYGLVDPRVRVDK